MSDTPLHFATKFAAVECVQLLLTYSCDEGPNRVSLKTNIVNKMDKRADEVICERKGDEAVKRKIAELFENQYYVPMIRTDDKVMIGKPIKNFTPSKDTAAVAGPTSPENALKLFKHLKSPARKNADSSVRLCDAFKGYERDASKKCKEIGVPWAEYWQFLDATIDLVSDDGLTALEQHLRKKFNVSACHCNAYQMWLKLPL